MSPSDDRPTALFSLCLREPAQLPDAAVRLWAALDRSAIPQGRRIDLLTVAVEAGRRATRESAKLTIALEQPTETELRLSLQVEPLHRWLSEIAGAVADEFVVSTDGQRVSLTHPAQGLPEPPDEASGGQATIATLLLRLVSHFCHVRRTSAQLTHELEETNQGVLALYQDLDDQAEKLRDLNETLEHRVAERTAEAEQRAVKLRAMAMQLSEVEQQERRRLAETLHDHLQQLLVAGKMRLALLPAGTLPATAQQELEQLFSESIRITKDLTVQLSPPVLHHAGLVPALRWLADRMQQQHKLEVRVACDDDFDPPLNPQVKQLMFESVRELLFNAIKHAGVQAAAIACRLAADDVLEVDVVDEGAGFDVRRVEAAPAGGFGLMSVRERLECLGGRMSIDSAPGRGTRVTLRTPTHPDVDEFQAEPAATPDQPSPPVEVEASDRGKPIRLLLVDDHRIVREGLRAMLEAGEDVIIIGEADNGEDAIRLTSELWPDGVVMDVNMPRLDGISATRRIREHRPQVKVIGLSMHHEQEIFDAMRDAGAVACLRKDEAGSELVALVRRVMSGTIDDELATSTDHG